MQQKQSKAEDRGAYSALSRHTRNGTKLLHPFHRTPLEPIQWERDLLPEHIWIASLAAEYPAGEWETLYSELLDALDALVPDDIVLLGMMSDFNLIPEDRRPVFLSAGSKLIYRAFHRPLGRILAFYPESPAHWLVQKDRLGQEGPLDADVEMARLRRLIIMLLPGKDLVAGHIRTIPLTRPLKHRKLYLPHPSISPRIRDIVDVLERYPARCTDHERYQVQQFARAAINVTFMTGTQYSEKAWPKYFWRHNYDLVPCRPHHIELAPERCLKPEEDSSLCAILKRNVSIAVEYVDSLWSKIQCDLYDPERSEILLGLFSRITRLYILIAADPNLWARDIAGIVLRCLVDTAVTFAYLVSRGTDQEFSDFARYGEGKEKLLMLHLQETYREEESLEGRTATQIAEDLGGGFAPELIDIELGNWTKKSARDLAIAAGLEEFYHLVYDPASSDVHGTWVSLKRSNLSRCAEPLHRFHRLPSYMEPPLYANTIIAAQRVYQHCLAVGMAKLGFPSQSEKLDDIVAPRS